MDTVINDEDKYQVGKTKIFLRAGQVRQRRDEAARAPALIELRLVPRPCGLLVQMALLDKLLHDRLRALAVLVQKTLRMRVVRKRYQRLRAAAILAQKRSAPAQPQTATVATHSNTWAGANARGLRGGSIVQRGRLARTLYANLCWQRATLILRKFVLRNVQRKRYIAWRAAIVRVQTGTAGAATTLDFWHRRYRLTLSLLFHCGSHGAPAIRAWHARNVVAERRRHVTATRIQAVVRGWLCRRRYHRHRYLVIRCAIDCDEPPRATTFLI